jgi:hypothetical protein
MAGILIDAAACIRSHPVNYEIQLPRKLNNSFGKDGDLILALAMSKLLYQFLDRQRE